MTIFILVSILLVATLAIALLMGVSPASQKAKVRTMYVGAALMLVVALIVCDYIDALPDFLSKFLFIVLGLLIMVSSICGIKRAFTLKSYGFERWYLMLISAIVTLVLAVTIVLYPTLYGDMLMMAIGIVMIIEAVSDLLGIHRLSKFIKDNVTITYGE